MPFHTDKLLKILVGQLVAILFSRRNLHIDNGIARSYAKTPTDVGSAEDMVVKTLESAESKGELFSGLEELFAMLEKISFYCRTDSVVDSSKTSASLAVLLQKLLHPALRWDLHEADLLFLGNLVLTFLDKKAKGWEADDIQLIPTFLISAVGRKLGRNLEWIVNTCGVRRGHHIPDIPLLTEVRKGEPSITLADFYDGNEERHLCASLREGNTLLASRSLQILLDMEITLAGLLKYPDIDITMDMEPLGWHPEKPTKQQSVTYKVASVVLRELQQLVFERDQSSPTRYSLLAPVAKPASLENILSIIPTYRTLLRFHSEDRRAGITKMDHWFPKLYWKITIPCLKIHPMEFTNYRRVRSGSLQELNALTKAIILGLTENQKENDGEFQYTNPERAWSALMYFEALCLSTDRLLGKSNKISRDLAAHIVQNHTFLLTL